MNEKNEKDHVTQFLHGLEIEKNYSSHTITNYKIDLDSFFSFIQKSFKFKNPSKIEKKHLRAYLVHLTNKKYKSSTIRRKLASIRSFYNYCVKRDIFVKNPCEEITMPKSEKTIPSWLGIDEMFAFLDSIKVKTWMDARNKAVFEFMYSTGVRVSELVNLDFEDFDFTGYVKIMGKGNRERILPVGGKAIDEIKSYISMLEERFPGFEATGPLFLNRYKKRISDRSIRRILDRLLTEAGIYYKISPHKIRHSFATHMLDNGVDLRFIQEFLNHRSLSTTQKYTHVTMEKLMAVYDNSHPRH